MAVSIGNIDIDSITITSIDNKDTNDVDEPVSKSAPPPEAQPNRYPKWDWKADFIPLKYHGPIRDRTAPPGTTRFYLSPSPEPDSDHTNSAPSTKTENGTIIPIPIIENGPKQITALSPSKLSKTKANKVTKSEVDKTNDPQQSKKRTSEV